MASALTARQAGVRAMPALEFLVRAESFCIHRLPATASVDPGWLGHGDWISVTRTESEWSIVAPDTLTVAGSRVEAGWSCLQVAGVLDFSLVGILARIAGTLADAGVSLFAVSTFDTDHILVKTTDLPTALAALVAAGHRIIDRSPGALSSPRDAEP